MRVKGLKGRFVYMAPASAAVGSVPPTGIIARTMKRHLTPLLALAFLAGLGGAAHAQTPAGVGQVGDPQAGERKIAMCAGCHGIPGYRSGFPEQHRVPMIVGQPAGYMVAALTAYRKGERKHPTMRAIAGSLTDEDMADIAAFYAQQAGQGARAVPDTPSRQPSQRVGELLQKGACASCHGANYSKPIDGSYPKIAGQHADYLFVALKSYKIENNPNIGRGNAIMAAQVKQFSFDELRAMADYLGSLEGDLRTVAQSRFHDSRGD